MKKIKFSHYLSLTIVLVAFFVLVLKPVNSNAQCIPGTDEKSITIEINTDFYADEISWKIFNLLNEVVFSGDSYGYGENTYTYEICLKHGDYRFEAYDTWGDGWNDTYWGRYTEGSYVIRYADETEIINSTFLDGDSQITNFTVEENQPPYPSITSSSSITSGAFDVTITFDEIVTEFELADITIGNGTADNLSGSGATYSATITPTTEGTVTIDVAADIAIDATGNNNIEALQFSIFNDETQPTPVITSTSSVITSGAFDVTITFDEIVTGFELADITVENGIASNFSESGTTYTATITPTTDGTVTVDVAADVASDAAGNINIEALQFSILNDGTQPTPAITSTTSAITNRAFDIAITFDEIVTGFELDDITVENGIASNFSGSGDTYSFTISNINVGPITVNVAAGAAIDAAGNNNIEASISILDEMINTVPVAPWTTLAFFFLVIALVVFRFRK